MKRLSLLILLAITSIFVGCTKETADRSFVTYYANFDMSGESYMIVVKGETYNEPGVTAEANGEQLEVSIDGTVDTNTPAVYTLTYSATNADGYDATIQRTVRVVAEGAATGLDIAGTYNGIRVNKGAGGPVYIIEIAQGVFEVSDFLGGYYETYAGYGSAYAANGIFTRNDDGTFTGSQGFVPGWGDVTEANNIVVDGDVITFDALMVGAGFGFQVQLTKKAE